MPKTVLSSKFQEWKGLDQISLVVHEMKCIFREITKDDYGLDGEIEVVVPKSNGQGYETNGGIIKVQAKSGMSYVKENNDTSFSTPVSKNDLQDWHNAPYPVFFIVYHPDDDKLYYKEIKSYVRTTPNVFKSPLKVIFDKSSDVFNKECYEQVSQSAAVSPSRISTEQREKLYTNLLLVKREPKHIYFAPTHNKTHDEIKKAVAAFVPPFTVVGGTLFTLANLHDDRCVLRDYCNTDKIDRQITSRWVTQEGFQNEYIFILNQLLGSHLRRCGLTYNRDFKRNYFPRRNDSSKVFLEDWYNIRTSRSAPARIVAKFYKYGCFEFWRHLAVNLSFRRIGSSWFLQIVPKLFFTEDGETPCSNELVGPYTTRIKAQEHNNQVLNHVLFWTDILSMRKPSIELSLFHKTALVIEKEPFSGIANFSIPNDPAVFEEETDQPSIFSLIQPDSEAIEDEYDEHYF